MKSTQPKLIDLHFFKTGNPIDMAYDLRTNYGMKIYAIGIGKSIDKRELRLLVGQRNKGHIFQLEKFEDFDAIIEKLTYKGEIYSGINFLM